MSDTDPQAEATPPPAPAADSSEEAKVEEPKPSLGSKLVSRMSMSMRQLRGLGASSSSLDVGASGSDAPMLSQASIASTLSAAQSAAAAPAPALAVAPPREAQYGDIVYLTCTRTEPGTGAMQEGFVHSEGVSDQRLGLIWVPEGAEPQMPFGAMTFRICPKLSYKASKTLSKFERNNSIAADQLASQIEYLREKKEREDEVNRDTIRTVSDAETVVNYGQVVQLQHVGSGRFLTIVPRTLAEVEKECMKVELVEGGNEGSFFRFRPRFKNRVDGKPMYSGDQVTLASIKTEALLHFNPAAAYADDMFSRTEINVSNSAANSGEGVGFRVSTYLDTFTGVDRFLQTGQALRLFHPEAEAMLTASSNTTKTTPPYWFRKKKEEDDDIDDDVNLTTKSLFYLERPSARQGGLVQWGELVRLRHLASGKYLAVEHQPLEGERDALLRDVADTGPTFDCLLTHAGADDPRTFFRFHEVAGKVTTSDEDRAKGIPIDGLAIFLEHPLPEDCYVHEDDGSPEGELHTSCWLHNAKLTKTLDEDDIKANLQVAFCGNRLDENSLGVFVAEPEELLQAASIISAVPYGPAYVSLLKAHPGDADFPLTDRDVRHVERMLSNTIFMTIDDEEMQEKDLPMEAEGLPIEGPQQKMRELKLIDALFAILRAPIEAGLSLEQLHEPHNHVMLRIHRLCFKAIEAVFSRNPRNELYVTAVTFDAWLLDAKHTYMLEIAQQLGHGLGAADCLKALISHNVKVLEERIDASISRRFLELLQQKGPVEDYLEFLDALCACQGKTVYSNQEMLLRDLYSAGSDEAVVRNRRELLVETALDAGGSPTPWLSAPGARRPADPFLGESVFDNGLHDLYITWAWDNDWAPGRAESQQALFTSPRNLGVDTKAFAPPAELAAYRARLGEDGAAPLEWVRLEDVAWTLDPAKCHQKVYGMPWREAELEGDAELKRRFDLKKQLAGYYVAQIHTFAAMCEGRTYTCISKLEQQFTFETVISGMANQRLPDMLRTAFASLMTIYVDRFPHEPLQLPNLVVDYDSVADFSVGDAGVGVPHFALSEEHPLLAQQPELAAHRTASKFFLLQDAVMAHLAALDGDVVIADVEANKLTVEMMSLVLLLVKLGFYGSIDALERLAGPIIQLLDGRGDMMTESERERASGHKGGRLGHVLSGAKNLVRRNRGNSGGGGGANVQDVAGEEKGVELTDMSANQGEGGDDADDAVDGFQAEVKRYLADPEQLVVTAAKSKMCEILDVISDIRDDYRLRKLLVAVKARGNELWELLPGGSVPPAVTINGESRTVKLTSFQEAEEREKEMQPWLSAAGVRAFNELFSGSEQTAESRRLDINQMDDIPIVTTCLDLMMYEDPELFEAALKTLVRYTSQRQALVSHLQSVQLLTSADRVQAHRSLSQGISVLKTRLDSFETWGLEGEFSSVNQATADSVMAALAEFGALCVTEEEVATLRGPETVHRPDAEYQDLFRNLGIHHVIMRAYELPVDEAELKSRQGIVFNLRKLANDFLSKYAMGNGANQETIFPFLQDVFLPQVGSGTGIAALIAAIFRDNRAMCARCPEEVLWQFAGQIEKKGCFKRFLEFFFSVVAPGGAPLKRNQELVVDVFSDLQFKVVRLLYSEGVEPENQSVAAVREVPGYLQRLADMQDADKAENIAYHARLVELLAICCKGKNTACEIKCQSMLPLHVVLAVITDERTVPLVRAAYVSFLSEVYFETDLSEFDSIASDQFVWRFLDSVANEMLAVHEAAAGDGMKLPVGREGLTVLYTTYMPAVETFFANRYSADALVENAEATPILDNLKNGTTLLLDLHGVPPRASSLLTSMASTMGVIRDADSDAMQRRMSVNSIRASKRQLLAGPEQKLKEFEEALCHDFRISELVTEDFDELAAAILEVHERTDPDSPEYKRRCARGDPVARADMRSNAIQFEHLVQRICAHVKDDHDDNVPLVTAAVRALAQIVDFKQPQDRERNKKTYQVEEVDEPASYTSHDRRKEYDAFVKTQTELDSFGCSRLVIDLLSDPALDDRLAIQALKLGIELLEGGNEDVQRTIYEYCEELGDDADKFFIALQKRIQRAVLDIQQRRRMAKFQARMSPDERKRAAEHPEEEEDEDMIGVDLVFRMLQLFAEGHNLQMQDLMRDQSSVGVRNSTNLVEEAITFLTVLAKNEKQLRKMSGEDSQDLVALLEFLTEIVQGPCDANQVLLANSVMVDTCATITWVKFKVGPNINELEVRQLKGAAMQSLLSLLEGRTDLLVHEVLAVKLEPSLLKTRLVEIHQAFLKEQKLPHSDEDWDEEFLAEGFDLLKMVKALTAADAVAVSDECQDFNNGMMGPSRSALYKEKDREKIRARARAEAMYQAAMSYFQSRMASIEVFWGEPAHLERIYFPLPSEADFMPESAKQFIKSQAEYGTDDQTAVLMTHKDKLIDQMQHVEYLSNQWIYRKLGVHIELLKFASFLLAVVMNTMLVMALEAGDNEDSEPVYNPTEIETVMLVLGIPQLVLSSIVLAFLSANRFPLIKTRHLRDRKNFELQVAFGVTDVLDVSKMLAVGAEARDRVFALIETYSGSLKVAAALAAFTALLPIRLDTIPTAWLALCVIIVSLFAARDTRQFLDSDLSWVAIPYKIGYDFLTESDTLFYVLYVACAALGLLFKPYFYVFHLLDLVAMSDSLKNVVRAVTQPGKALTLTAILGVIVIYLFTLLGFFFFHESFYNADAGMNECRTMLMCFVTFLRNGLISGGGIGDFASGELGHFPDLNNTELFAERAIFDLLYFVTVIILLLNIIFGIIIDTFGALREGDAERDDLMRNYCFICSVPKDTFDNLGRDVFKKHIAEEHNMWDYLMYLAYLTHKDETEYSGAETYINNLVKEGDVSWFPHQKALVLSNED